MPLLYGALLQGCRTIITEGSNLVMHKAITDALENDFLGIKGLTTCKQCFFNSIKEPYHLNYGHIKDGGVGSMALEWVTHLMFGCMTAKEYDASYNELLEW